MYRVYDDVSDREYDYESDSDWNGVYKHDVELKYCEPLNEHNSIKQYYNDENKNVNTNTQHIKNDNDSIVEFPDHVWNTIKSFIPEPFFNLNADS